MPPTLPPASIGCPLPPYTENRKTLHFCIDPLVSVNFCDFLTPTDAVIENPQKYLAAEKYYKPNRLGWRQKVLQPPSMFMLLSWWCPLGHGKRHLPAIQIFIAVRLIPILTHLSSGWTVPLTKEGFSKEAIWKCPGAEHSYKADKIIQKTISASRMCRSS